MMEGRRFKSICHIPYHLKFKNQTILEAGKEYNIITQHTPNGNISHYDIYDGDIPLIVNGRTIIQGLSVVSFPEYLLTLEQMREFKLNNLLNG